MLRSFISTALLDVLVCPVCHHKLEQVGEDGAQASELGAGANPAWLHCGGCGRYYPVEDGIAVMLEERATFEPVKR